MINPASAILDGLSAAGMHGRLVLGVLLLVIASQLLLFFLLRRIFFDRLRGEEYFSLSLAGWLLPASLLSLLWYTGARISSPQLSLVVVAILTLGTIFLLARSQAEELSTSRPVLWILISLAMLFIVLRLAFVSKAIFPLYFDSAQHYRFIDELLASLGISASGAPSPAGYYHRGFHFLAAFLTFLTGAQITDVILVLGQIFLALMPFAMFFIVRHWTRSSLAGFFALLLASFGWYMPAHAMDWGKYPALASLALLPFVLALAYLFLENRGSLPANRYWSLCILIAASALITVLLHSRSLVVYLLLAVAWLVTSAWNRMARRWQFLLLASFIVGLTAGIYFIHSWGVLMPLYDAYGKSAIPIAACVLVLSVFAWLRFPGLVFFCIVSVCFFIASLFLPLGNLIPGYVNTTPLDRPYVQMLLYLPLTLLAGFGLAGLELLLRDKKVRLGKAQLAAGSLVPILFILLVPVNAIFKYDLYPSDCCAIVSRDDLAAIDWMDSNLPKEARIVTASTSLNVLPTDEYQGSAGGDAGTWITPLTGRPVVYLPYNTDFSQSEILTSLCQQGVGYVYVGKTGWSFDEAGMSMQPGSYRLLLDLPKARIYEVTGCGPSGA